MPQQISPTCNGEESCGVVDIWFHIRLLSQHFQALIIKELKEVGRNISIYGPMAIQNLTEGDNLELEST